MSAARRSRFAPATLAVLAALAGGASAGAQDYPTRPINVIIPFAGGSASDVVTRILLERAGRSLGHPFVVDNRPGAGGNVGTSPPPRPHRTATRSWGPAPGRWPPTARSIGSRLRPGKGSRADCDVAVFPIVVVASTTASGEIARELIDYAKERPGSSTTDRSASAARSTCGRLFRAAHRPQAHPCSLPQHRAIFTRT